MRLRLENTGEVPFWFVGDPTKNERTEMSLALDESFGFQRNQQSVAGAEWESQKHFDRKNQRFTVSATVHYEFADDWARMDFLARLMSLDPTERLHKWQGQVWLRVDKQGTTEFREWRLADAIITLNAPVPRGTVGLDLRYTVTCKGFAGAQQGLSETVKLMGRATLPLMLRVPASEMQALVDDAQNASTIDFPISVSVTLISGGAVSVQRWFLPVGSTGVPGISFVMPIAGTCLTDFVASITSSFPSLAITNDADVLSLIDSAPLTTATVTVTLRHRYSTGSGGGTVTDDLAAWSGTGQDSLLIGTLGGVTYLLTGKHEQLTA